MKRIFLFVSITLTSFFFSCDSKTASSSTNPDYEKSKEINNAVLKAMEQGDWASMDKYIAADAVDHAGSTGELKGLDAIKQEMMKFKAAYPDVKFEVLGTAMDGDLFYCWSKMTGTQKGEFMGMPATNQPITSHGVDIVKVKDGKMIEHWFFVDMAETMKMMGGAGGDKPAGDSSKMAMDSTKK